MGFKDNMPYIQIIRWKEEYFIWFNSHGNQSGSPGELQLIDKKGEYICGPRGTKDIKEIKQIPCFKIGTWWFFRTKIGVFNALTGEQTNYW